ncbi:MAG: anthranilate phosphoribosyltransferase [Bacteroidaceae bacterium]|nr:anthranilate phosphoribosyltransferase [Bacteroidaceae bacterium]
MKEVLKRLIAGGENLKREEVKDIMVNITHEAYPTEQIAALLIGLQMKGITDDELLGFRDGLLETGTPVDLSPYQPIDIVGTGGDGKNTFNISTCACFVVAGAGYKVAKHGNYAATSVSGASSVLENHGVKFQKDPDKLRQSMEETGMVYLHAPLFANGMKYVGPVRKALGVPTCFNLLGPLINPCRPTYQLLGVANLSQMRLYNSVLQKIDVEYGIVNSTDGYDEISLTGAFKVLTRHSERVWNVQETGLEQTKAEDIYGGKTAEEAKKLFDNVLEGTSTKAQKDVVLANAAFAIQLIAPEKALEECLAEARESLESGKALQTLKRFIEINS